MATSADRKRPQPSISETFRRRVRSRAADLGFTHDGIAKRLRLLGVPTTRRSISHLVAGDVRPNLDELHELAVALETTEGYLLGFTFDPTPEEPAPAILADWDTPGYPNQHRDMRVIRVRPGGDDAPRPIQGNLLIRVVKGEEDSGGRSGGVAGLADVAAGAGKRKRRDGEVLHGKRAEVPRRDRVQGAGRVHRAGLRVVPG